MGRLDNKIAIITGGAGGIGVATAKLFIAEGANVVLADLNEDSLQKAVDDIGSDAVSFVAGNVTDESDVKRLVDETVSRHGKLDVFFANAGIEGHVKPIEDQTAEDFDKVIAVNVRGVFLGLKYAIPAIRQAGGGSIIITSSVAGLVGSAGLSPYVASKHAVVGLSRTAAVENAAHGIRVNTIHPAPIETRMMRAIEAEVAPEDAEGAKKQFEAGIRMGRYGTPEEVAKLALFLASDDSSYSTGSRFLIDGGWTA
ncbi:MAG TPA: SDR family NAD(P)-dependent oxidoreductase [Actinomycetaceae bacterium]|nr:SDR family NAD(P)-dependent oxidoreductase [Actinomycetaceae bacterium]